MTELELSDRLNPKRDLPQATCDIISQVYKVMEPELLEKENQIKHAEKQLTEAKEIIRRLINACCSYGATGKTTADAEAFLEKE